MTANNNRDNQDIAEAALAIIKKFKEQSEVSQVQNERITALEEKVKRLEERHD